MREEHIKKYRTGMFMGLLLALLVIFLHNPIAGYTTSYEVESVRPAGCTSINTLEQLKAASLEDISKQFNECAGSPTEKALPFTAWSSNEPIVNWLGSVMHLLQTLAFILIAISLWAWHQGAFAKDRK